MCCSDLPGSPNFGGGGSKFVANVRMAGGEGQRRPETGQKFKLMNKRSERSRISMPPEFVGALSMLL